MGKSVLTTVANFSLSASVAGFQRIASGFDPITTDLMPPPPQPGDERWLSSWFRLAIFACAALSYPLLLSAIGSVLPDEGSGVTVIASSFTPGVSILFGTLLSLTVSIRSPRRS